MSAPCERTPHFLTAVSFTQAEWDDIIFPGRQRTAQKTLFGSTRQARIGTHELGMVGEEMFSRLTGQPVNRSLLVNGDGKVDFVIDGMKFDVKTTAHFNRPWLRVTPEDLEEKKGDAFALVAVDITGRRARYCGYALRAAVANAPLWDMHDEMPDSHVLLEWQLIRKLPPGSRPG